MLRVDFPAHAVGVFLSGAIETAANPLRAEPDLSQEKLRGNVPFANETSNFCSSRAGAPHKLVEERRADAGTTFRLFDGAAEKSNRMATSFIDEISDYSSTTFCNERAATIKGQAEIKILS